MDIGLGYLSLNRPSGTLSGGEAQRTKMIRHLGSSLTDVTYVFDEPTIGLHPHDIQRMNDLLLQLRDKGNTVLVVEHKPETIAIADHVVDLGPQGRLRRRRGDVRGHRRGAARQRHDHRPPPRRPRLAEGRRCATADGKLEIRGADTNNLQDVDVDIPLGVLVVLTGVAGSGKSSLIRGSVAGRDGVVTVDQGAIRGSRRSNPATYTGLLDPIRKAFAKANGVKPGAVQRQLRGRLPELQRRRASSTPTSGSWPASPRPARSARASASTRRCSSTRSAARTSARCSRCRSPRPRRSSPTATRKLPAAHKILERLADVGLGYLTHRPAAHDAVRRRAPAAQARHPHGRRRAAIYVLDEPTTGLHLADVEQLLGLLDRLVDSGKSVIVIEHHQAVMAHADWIIDLGPGAGHDGGKIVFEGTPADLVAGRSTLTGEHLAAYVGA